MLQLEDEAREFSGQAMAMLEDRRRECNDHAEEIKQLHERVKYNYDRLDPLSEIPLKVSIDSFCFYTLLAISLLLCYPQLWVLHSNFETLDQAIYRH